MLSSIIVTNVRETMFMILLSNLILIRLFEIGLIPKELVLHFGITGIICRFSGVRFDGKFICYVIID